jgi:hypothetical protein
MRTGVPLHQIRREVMIEAGLSPDPGHEAFSRETLNQKINRTERIMAQEDEWPTQHYEQQVTVPPDAKWVSFPVGITPSSIRQVSVLFGTIWLPVVQGIGPAERTVYSDDMRATPISRWEINVDQPGQFEVWPRGAVQQTLLFSGTRKIGGMVDENDACTLDADVIVLRTAAKILARDRQEDAALLMGEAISLTQSILKAINAANPPTRIGGHRVGRVRRPGIDFIPPGTA